MVLYVGLSVPERAKSGLLFPSIEFARIDFSE